MTCHFCIPSFVNEYESLVTMSVCHKVRVLDLLILRSSNDRTDSCYYIRHLAKSLDLLLFQNVHEKKSQKVQEIVILI